MRPAPARRRCLSVNANRNSETSSRTLKFLLADYRDRRLHSESFSGMCCKYGFRDFRVLVQMLQDPSIGLFSKSIKHSVCFRYPICNTSNLTGHSLLHLAPGPVAVPDARQC
jgi:hypothetical protein